MANLSVKEIQAALTALNNNMFFLEEEYMENGGEVTESTEAREAVIAELKTLLTTEGVDTLGRWLKAKEDSKAALKAEKASIDRQIKSVENTIEYIKFSVSMILRQTGEQKVKGTCYSFTATESTKTAVDKKTLEEMFQEAVETKLRSGKDPVIPNDVTISLGASVSALPDGAELPSYYTRTTSPSVRFAKPKAAKE